MKDIVEGLNENTKTIDMSNLPHNGDVFEKAYRFTKAAEVAAQGMHPYFKPIASQYGGKVLVDGREMIITGSNDYLGLTQDPRLKQAARDALNDFGTSCTGSRFLTGTLTFHDTLEKRLASFTRKEAALTFSAGYLGCLSVISAIAGRHDIIYFDRENHACLYDGAKLSYGTLHKFEHNNMDALEQLLIRDKDKPGGRVIVTDGVFSMSGHIAKLPELVALKQKYNARLIVDDAHATGVIGPTGRGTAELYDLEDEVDIIVGTFSKSFASVGGFMAAEERVVDYIKHHARPFIFTAALPAMQVAAALKALDIIENEAEHREKLWANAHRFHDGMASLGFNTLGSTTPIVPVLIGELDMTLLFWRALWDHAIFTTPAVPPSVPANKCIIRTSVNANHETEDIDNIMKTFATVGKQFNIIS